MLGAVALFTVVFGGVRIGHDLQVAEGHEARAMLAIAEPNAIVKPDTNGFVLSILCDTDSSDSFTAEEDASDERNVRVERRNAHLAEETGAYIGKSIVPSVYETAFADTLSGDHTYSLYAAGAADELSLLLSAGLLRDVSDSQYIRMKDPWFDGAVMEDLSLYGDAYLISSSIADARQNTAVLVYDRALYARDAAEESGKTLSAVALDGELTLEVLLVESRAVGVNTEVLPLEETETADLAVSLSDEESFRGFGFGSEDIFPLYVAAGGSFATAEVTSLSAMRQNIAALTPILTDASSIENPHAFADGATLFSVHTLSEVMALREANADVGILPLPKRNAEEAYRCYVDPHGATMLALPRDGAEADKVEYLVYRMAFLSMGYIDPLFYENIAGESTDDREVLELILDSTVCDLSGLLGYGDIEDLVADTALYGDERLALNYYNRKTLYEKALSILEKRLNKDN